MARPEAQLLGNGDILVPVKGAGITRLHPDDADYPDALAMIQERDRPPGLVERALTFWGIGLLLLIGLPFLLMVLALLAGGAGHMIR